MLISSTSGESATVNLFWDCTWYVVACHDGQEHKHVLLAVQALAFVSIHLIQSETTQHAKLKLAGEKKKV